MERRKGLLKSGTNNSKVQSYPMNARMFSKSNSFMQQKWANYHVEDSLYFFLVEIGLNEVNHVKGSDPACDCMDFRKVRYGTHKSGKPLVHKINNMSDTDFFASMWKC